MKIHWKALLIAPAFIPALFSLGFVLSTSGGNRIAGFLILFAIGAVISYGATLALLLPVLRALPLQPKALPLPATRQTRRRRNRQKRCHGEELHLILRGSFRMRSLAPQDDSAASNYHRNQFAHGFCPLRMRALALPVCISLYLSNCGSSFSMARSTASSTCWRRDSDRSTLCGNSTVIMTFT
jgi:hypothetical protein